MITSIDEATIREVQPVLFGYAKRAVRRDDLARDLVQDAWVASLRYLPTFDGRSSFRSWMVGILKHKIVDHYRRSGRESALDDVLANAADPAPGPDYALQQARSLQQLASVLPRLPELQRRAVELCDVRGWAREEAAAELGVERGHLRVLLHRGRLRLRELLQSVPGRLPEPSLPAALGLSPGAGRAATDAGAGPATALARAA